MVEQREFCGQLNSLETERTRLTPLTAEDVERLHAILTDGTVREFLLDGEVVPRDFAVDLVRASAALFHEMGLGLWLAWRRTVEDSGGPAEPLGFVGFHRFGGEGSEPEVVFALLPAFVGRGLAREAAKAVVEAARGVGLRRVLASVDVANVRSLSVLKRLGFSVVGFVPGAFGERSLHALELVGAEESNPAKVPSRREVTLTRFWDGQASAEAGAVVTLTFTAAEVVVEVDAPYLGDPPPAAPVGSTERLYEHEVVEVFFLGEDAHYLEVELSPHGHYWVLGLHGRRNVVWQSRALLYSSTIQGSRWRGRARIPRAWLPLGLSHVNVTAMDGVGATRRYWSYGSSRSPVPDFHDLDSFVPLTSVLP